MAVRLAKVEDVDKKAKIMETINNWVQRNFYIIALASIILLLFIFIAVCFLIVGASATDSGLTYNQMERII